MNPIAYPLRMSLCIPSHGLPQQWLRSVRIWKATVRDEDCVISMSCVASEHLERSGQNPDACPSILRHRIFYWILRYIVTLEGATCEFFWCLGVLVCTFVPMYFLVYAQTVQSQQSVFIFFLWNQGCPLESDLRPLECPRKQCTQNIQLAGYQR